MAFTGYLKVPDIEGESKRAGHEGEIDVFGVHWGVAQGGSAATGSGRVRGRAAVQDFKFEKWCDASSVYLALACMQAKSFDEVVFMARKDSGDAHLDYLEVTLTNAMITGYEMGTPSDEEEEVQMIVETVSMTCEKIAYKYIEQADDHSAGSEHEIEFDVVAGA